MISIEQYDTTEFVVGMTGKLAFWKPTALSKTKLTGKQLFGIVGEKMYKELIEEMEDYGSTVPFKKDA